MTISSTPRLGDRRSRAVDAVWRFFCSPILVACSALLLGAALIASAAIGAQASPAQQHAKAYQAFELFDLSRSWWFTLLVLCLALGLLANTAERLPRILRGASGFQLTAKRAGVLLVPLSLIALMVGLALRLIAFEGSLDLSQSGGVADSVLVREPDGSMMKRKLGFFVRCDDLRLGKQPGAEAVESDISIRADIGGDPGDPLARQTIAADRPLRFGGVTIRQAGYRALAGEDRARLTLLDKRTGQRRELFVASGEEFEAGGARYAVADYNADFLGKGAAAQMLRVDAAGVRKLFWLFSKQPQFDRDHSDDRVGFAFHGLEPTYATDLMVVRDPAAPVLWAGLSSLVLGLALSLWPAPRGTPALGEEQAAAGPA